MKLSKNWKRLVLQVLSSLLLLNVIFPIHPQKVEAAQRGIESRIVKIAAGFFHSLALKADGTVVAWGDNNYGQTTVPAEVKEGVVAIAAGGYHSLALKADGTVVAWGYNSNGQTTVPVEAKEGVVAIAAGLYHSLALKADGTVEAWGDNNYGQTTVPVEAKEGVVAIAAGGRHSLALKADGTVEAWGDNNYGQTTVPVEAKEGVVAIAAGGYHSLALKADGTVEAWGYNYYGQTTVPLEAKEGVVAIAAGGYHSLALKADGTVEAWGSNGGGQRTVPAEAKEGVVAIAAGWDHSLALKADGTVEAWGYNGSGQTTVPKDIASPVKGSKIAAGAYHSLGLKADGMVEAWGDNYYGQTTVPVEAKEGVVAIAAGGYHSLVLKADGMVEAWGYNSNGQTTVPAEAKEGVVAIAAGDSHSLALKADGTVEAWGYNVSGQTTVPAEAKEGVVAITAGGYHSLALKTDGMVEAWGANNYGQTTVPVEAKEGVVAIAAGGYHSLALKADGTVEAWGYNGQGQTTVPAEAKEGVVAIAAGWNHSLGLKADGRVEAWGYNYFGQTTVPVEAKEGVVAIAAGLNHSLALKADGTVVAWGDNGSGQTTVPGDNGLKNLGLQEGVFDVPFSSEITSYTSYIGPSVSQVHVETGLEDEEYAALYVNDQLQVSGSSAIVGISADTTTINVRVEPYFKPSRTYTITVLRDLTPPAVTISSTASGTVNAPFPVKIDFSKEVTGFMVAGITVDNGTVTDFVAEDAKTYTATIVPLISGQAVTVQVAANAATDTVGNQNVASNVLSYLYDTTKPVVTFGGFTDHQVFIAPPASIHITVSEAVYGIANGDEVDVSDAATLLSMEKDGAPFSDYTVTYDQSSLTFTLTFDGTLGDSAYHVKVAGDEVQNANHNSLDAASASFTVAVPVVTNITAQPASLAHTGGDVTVSIAGMHLIGQKLDVYVDGIYADTAVASNDTSAEAVVTLPRNHAANAKSHSLKVYLNGTEQAGPSATVTVMPAEQSNTGGGAPTPAPGPVPGPAPVPAPAKPYIDVNGTRMNPEIIDLTKPSYTLEATPKEGAVHVSIPATVLSGFADKNASFVLEIKTPYGSYLLPVQLGVLIPGLQDVLTTNTLKIDEISLRISLTDRSDDKNIQTTFTGDLPNGKVMSAIVDFGMEIVNTKTGQSIGNAEGSNKALTRMIPLPKRLTVLPKQWGAFRYDEKVQKFEFVAARSVQIEGVWYAMIQSNINSVYVVAENPLSFTDVKKDWSQPYVELAAAKGLVNGVGGGKYAPERSVTRAEFTAMLVRALGRSSVTAAESSPYQDILPGEWYSSVVAQAKKLGLLGFAGSDSFLPDQPLTREEIASMLMAAIVLEELPITREDSSPSGYKDLDSVDATNLESIRLMQKLNIMQGTGKNTFSPKSETTREQAAIVLIRIMRALGKIDL
ncbi:S-layer homology domain-containing protein [Paenibacillus taichungensis]|uniref:RCC1 domain-containing protein n=1 Tax=Paenibacillus taichungensis TaxID=484184 RepID=UPI0039A4169F